MKKQMSFDDFDDHYNPRPEESEFSRIVDVALSRRGFLGGAVTLGLGNFLRGVGGLPQAAQAASDRFGFSPLAANRHDSITVPDGFEWKMLISWGDPLWSDAPAFNQTTRGDAASQARAVGDNNDGMALFFRGGRNVMAVNNEYVNHDILYGNRASGLPENMDDINKGKAAHGVSVFEVADRDGDWTVVKDSIYNRRITADTPMQLSGPAAGHSLLKTQADPSGTQSLGTWNNCGNGRTPWGTYLACEENFNSYFSSSDENINISKEFKRYGIGVKDGGYAWVTADERFDIAKHPNEPNRAGYVVEIDPFSPDSTPKKRTALGRFKHENAEVVLAADGRVVVYMGDDERGEFLYKFVSDGVYSAAANNSDLLDEGVLYVAKFSADGRGEWLPLTEQTVGMSAAEIAVHTRLAASAVGATTMDRPEWVTTNPLKTEAYCALTNNKNRGVKTNAGGDDTPVGGPNPRAKNIYGQIVRWMPDNADHAAAGFSWNLFAMAGNPTVHDDANKGSANITPENMFNSPDGLAFDRNGLLWIQTDGNYSNEGDFVGMGNNQMLVGDTQTGEIRRFMVGPRQAEVTGICWSPDRRTLFVGVQHPGEGGGDSHFPDGGDSVPRSSIITIKRSDGSLVG